MTTTFNHCLIPELVLNQYVYYGESRENKGTTSVQTDHPFEDVQEIDTSFFCTERFTADIIEKNLRQAIHLAASKADACRRIMALETCGYIVLSNVSDERKAELINPFAAPRFAFCGDDFVKARSRGKS